MDDFRPAYPQFLSGGKVASFTSPQTQFVVEDGDLKKAKRAANEGLANYGSASDHGVTDIPPAGVYVGANGMTPAALLTQG
jgi:hypothetical protein